MGNVEKPIEKFKKLIQTGAVYEAQQFIKTVYHRLRSRKLFDDSKELLARAACLQLEQEQVTCGSELATLLINSNTEDRNKADDLALSRAYRILEAFEATSSAATTEYTSFAKSVIKWVNTAQGSPEKIWDINARIAAFVWKRHRLEGLRVAVEFYSRSSNMREFAAMLSSASKEFAEGEADLLVIQAEANILTVPGKNAAAKLELAEVLLLELHSQLCIEEDSIAAHFLFMFLKALEKGSKELTSFLIEEYRAFLTRSPPLMTALQLVQNSYCGESSRSSGLDGLLGGLLRSFIAPC